MTVVLTDGMAIRVHPAHKVVFHPTIIVTVDTDGEPHVIPLHGVREILS